MRGPVQSDNSREEEQNRPSTSTTGHEMCFNDQSGHQLACVKNSSKKSEENGPIWNIGRKLVDSFSKGKMRRTKIFGAPLEELPLNCKGTPFVAFRLCSFLEKGIRVPNLFVSFKKAGKLVERYKIAFDRSGDADLESCDDLRIIAALLKMWLYDLPTPLIPVEITERLVKLFKKYDQKEVYELNAEINNVLVECPQLNLSVLYMVIRLLFIYVNKWFPSRCVDQLPDMFSKLLLGIGKVEHIGIITTMIHNFRDIFNERIVQKAFNLFSAEHNILDDGNQDKMITSDDCGNHCFYIEKFMRSNSEEQIDHGVEAQKRSTRRKKTYIRRVNSHEDFQTRHNLCRSVNEKFEDEVELNNNNKYYRGNGYRSNEDAMRAIPVGAHHPVVDEVVIAPPPFHYNDANISEEIRNSERYAQPYVPHRRGRRIRSKYGKKLSRTVDYEPHYIPAEPKTDESANDNYSSDSSKAPNNSVEVKQDSDSQSNSSTSSGSSSDSPVSINPLPSFSEAVPYIPDASEPLSCYGSWSFAHRNSHTLIEDSSSPNSMINFTKYAHQDDITLRYSIQMSNVEANITRANKHLQWLNKKLKRFDSIFEDKFGEISISSNKMMYPEYQHLSCTGISLKNELKQLRREANEYFKTHRFFVSKDPKNGEVGQHSTEDKKKAAQEAELQLIQNRTANERSDLLEEMTVDQLEDEKVSIQKELMYLENRFGIVTVRSDDVFRPIYARYISVKRFLARSSTFTKQKEITSDLATIIENETMHYDTATPVEDKISPTTCEPSCNKSRKHIDLNISNIHELSSQELMAQYRATKAERKRLKKRMCSYEEPVFDNTIVESKHCIHSLRMRYKQTKAKLKLLDALLAKSK